MDEQVRNTVDNSTVHGSIFQAREVTVNLPRAGEVQWPMVIGRIPPEASAFQPRAELRQAIDVAREQYGTIVLSQVLAGGGGVGKSQLAAHYAREAVDAGVELVLWADAAEPAGLTDRYARAAAAVGMPGVTGTAEEDAERFLAWLAVTERSWLIVLDNATEHTPDELWPATSRGGRGRVIATTRHRGAASTGGSRTLVDISTYSAAESAAYLCERLERANCAHLLDEHAADLAEALGHLPLALAHAAAYLVNTRRSSGRYLQLFRDRSRSLDSVLPARSGADGYRGAVTAALLLSLDAAQQEEPVGLARPALELAALLDPTGHPESLWATQPVLDHLGTVNADDARDALAVLHNYHLITLTEAPHREVTLHALTARATLDTALEGASPHLAVADGISALWPENDFDDRDLAAVLRTNAEALLEVSGDLLWDPYRGVHLAVHRAGLNLIDAGLFAAGIHYWNKLVASNDRILGSHHLDSITARTNLARCHQGAGEIDEAIVLGETVLAAAERGLGPLDTETITAGSNLAAYYQLGGRIDQAIRLGERTLAKVEHVFGVDHPRSLLVLGNLATCYAKAGRTTDAVTLREQALAKSEHILGSRHPHTLTAKHNLAASYRDTGRATEAITLLECVVADRGHVLGRRHPDTLSSRVSLATDYMNAGRIGEAIEILEPARTDVERVLGSDHLDTLTTHTILAVTYWASGRAEEAARFAGLAVAGNERVFGSADPLTVQLREGMASVGFRSPKRPAGPDQRDAAQESSRRRASSDGVPGSAV